MTNPITVAARAAAWRLEPEGKPGLRADVEAVLAARQARAAPARYSDPVALASLIVSLVSLAWTIYSDQRERTTHPSVEDVVRELLSIPAEGCRLASHHLVDVVVTEVIRAAEDADNE